VSINVVMGCYAFAVFGTANVLARFGVEMPHVLNHNLSNADWSALSEDQDRAFAAADRIWREN